MRERIARIVAVIAVLLVAALAVVFAREQNPVGADPTGPEPMGPTAEPLPRETGGERAGAASDSIGGRTVFEERGCGRCHSVAGVGNPRHPLDGVGSRRTLEQLRAWTVGDDILADSLAPSTFRTKQGFGAIPEDEMAALLQYLESLKEGS